MLKKTTGRSSKLCCIVERRLVGREKKRKVLPSLHLKGKTFDNDYMHLSVFRRLLFLIKACVHTENNHTLPSDFLLAADSNSESGEPKPPPYSQSADLPEHRPPTYEEAVRVELPPPVYCEPESTTGHQNSADQSDTTNIARADTGQHRT